MGIGIQELIPDFKKCLIYTLVTCAIILFLLLYYIRKNFAFRFIYRGFIIYVVIVLAGIFSYQISRGYIKFPSGHNQYSCIVNNAPILKEKSIQIDCRISRIGVKKIHPNFNEKVRLYLEPDSTRSLPEIGDIIYFKGKLSKINNPGNPDEFDYAQYLKRQGIHYSGYIKEANYSFGGNSGKHKLRRLASQVQNRLITYFENYNIRDNELAVLSALVAGNRSFLEQELRESYAAVGAMHILAVSGLHVGILYLILISLFGNRNQKLYYRLVRTIVILAIIWMYAFITGLSVSVMRASVMFSLFLVGKNLQRQVNSYNILAASALLILIFNPAELFNVGFQFSYVAVLGIIYFQPRIEKLVFIRNGILDRVWQLFTVSIAAQLVTFPLGLYYFHQFPVYFWLTNMVVIPLVWLIMAGAILFTISILFTFFLPYVTFVLEILLRLLNNSINFIEQLPFSAITGIRFESIHLLAFYATLILIMILITQKQYKYLLPLAGALIITITAANIITLKKASDKKELIIYNVRNNDLVISIIDGINHTLITKGIVSIENNNTIKYLRNYWISNIVNRNIKWIKSENTSIGKIYRDHNLEIKFVREGFLINFYNSRYFYKNKPVTTDSQYSDTVEAGTLIIDYDSGYPVPEIFNQYKPDLILTISAITQYRKNIWREFAEHYGIKYYDMQLQGAYQRRFIQP